MVPFVGARGCDRFVQVVVEASVARAGRAAAAATTVGRASLDDQGQDLFFGGTERGGLVGVGCMGFGGCKGEVL